MGSWLQVNRTAAILSLKFLKRNVTIRTLNSSLMKWFLLLFMLTMWGKIKQLDKVLWVEKPMLSLNLLHADKELSFVTISYSLFKLIWLKKVIISDTGEPCWKPKLFCIQPFLQTCKYTDFLYYFCRLPFPAWCQLHTWPLEIFPQ